MTPDDPTPPAAPMTTPTNELDDPALVAEIEAEFAALTQELQRISAMPHAAAPDKRLLIEKLREEWREKAKSRGERPAWRKKLDDALDEAIDKILAEGFVETPEGGLAFQLAGDTLQTQAPGVLQGLIDSFTTLLQQKLAAPPTGPQSPLQGLFAGLGQMLLGALAKIQMTPQPTPAPAPEPVPEPVPEPAPDTTNAATSAPPPPFQAAADQFFSQLFAGLGQAVSQALRPTAAPTAAPAAPTAAPAAPTPPPASTSTSTSTSTPDAPTPATPTPDTPPTAPVILTATQSDAPPDQKPAALAVDLQGLLGQLLAAVTKPKP